MGVTSVSRFERKHTSNRFGLHSFDLTPEVGDVTPFASMRELENVMTDSPQFIGLLGQREIVLIQKLLHENNATEEEMKKLFEEDRMGKWLIAALQEVRAEILVQRGES